MGAHESPGRGWRSHCSWSQGAAAAEDQFSPKVVEQIAAETGTKVVSDLFDDSLASPPLTSYEQVVRWDVTHIVDALK
jgi:ABC-type Zn uptake system ZnuABC Zn-binding protein ZnuA